jgi:hypothetical protein
MYFEGTLYISMNILHTKEERDGYTTTCKSVRELMSAMYGV